MQNCVDQYYKNLLNILSINNLFLLQHYPNVYKHKPGIIPQCLQLLYNNKTKINLYKVKPNLMQINKIRLMQWMLLFN